MNSSEQQSIEEQTLAALRIRIPVRVFIGIVAVLGIIGNSHVLFLYYTRFKKTTYRCFVLSLAVIDMIGCCVSMPFEIVDESLPLSFTDATSCKIFRFVNFCVGLSCAFTLVLIATERYRKICKPYENQMSVSKSKRYVIFVITVTVFVSIPVLYIYGPKTIKLKVGYGKECTWGDHMAEFAIFGYIYAGFLTLLIVFCMIALSVIYSIIGISLKKHERLMRARLNKNHRDSIKLRRTFSSSNDLCKNQASTEHRPGSRLSHSCEELLDAISREKDKFRSHSPKDNHLKSETRKNENCQKGEEVCDVSNSEKRLANVNNLNHQDKTVQRERPQQLAEIFNSKLPPADSATDARVFKNSRVFDLKSLKKSFPVERKEKKITKVLVAITLLFIASFFPYVIIVIVFFTNPEYENNMTSSQETFYLIGFRLYNINNMANPFFYFFFDLKFREEVFSLYRSLCKKETHRPVK